MALGDDELFARVIRADEEADDELARTVLGALAERAPAAVAVENATVLAVPLDEGWLLVGFAATGEFAAAVAARRAPAPERRDALTHAALSMRGLLERLRKRVARHAALLPALERQSGSLGELAESIRLFSINAMIAAQRVADGDEIGAVAGLMQDRSDVVAPELRTLVEALGESAVAIREAEFRVAAALLLADALLAGQTPRVLADVLADSAERAAAGMRDLDAALDRLAEVARGVEHHLRAIRALEVNGRIEAARANDTEHVRMLFEEIGNQVRDATIGLKKFTVLSWRSVREEGGARAEARRHAAAIHAALTE